MEIFLVKAGFSLATAIFLLRFMFVCKTFSGKVLWFFSALPSMWMFGVYSLVLVGFIPRENYVTYLQPISILLIIAPAMTALLAKETIWNSSRQGNG